MGNFNSALSQLESGTNSKKIDLEKIKAEAALRAAAMTHEEILQEFVNEENDRRGNLKYFDCPLCNNKGYLAKLDGEYYYHWICSCIPRRKTYERIEKSGLKMAIAQKTFQAFVTLSPLQKSMKQFALEYLSEGAGAWLLFGGQVGSGKTHLCTALCGQYLRQGKNVVYLPYMEEIPRLKRAVNDEEQRQKIIDVWQCCDVLYIDDLFKGGITEADIKAVFEIIDYRYRNRKQTVVSSEKTINELLKIDEAIASRIKESCGKWLFNVNRNQENNYRMNPARR